MLVIYLQLCCYVVILLVIFSYQLYPYQYIHWIMKPELISKTISKDTIYNLTFSDIVFKFQCSRIGATYYDKPKGNTQFMFLCNPQKSGTPQVCIIFLHTIKKN